jgi:phospholipase/lecithinase/hemolysin
MRLGLLALAAALVASPSHSAFAASFSGIYTFGDSLSDAGNASIATAGVFPGPGYATRSVPLVPFPVGYFTNPQVGSGPSGLWVDQLAATLGITDPQPSLAPLGGTNYAIGSADTGTGLASMTNQIALFLTRTGGLVPSTGLYTFWGGANDIFDGLNPVAAADNIANQILTLHAAGANTFLWLNLPALGRIPEFSGNAGAAALANAASAAFNAEYNSRLLALESLGINVIGVDVNALFNSINANPAAFGFTNTTTACAITPGCNPNSALYWDLEHPTTYADSFVASLAAQDLAPTPEPSSITLLTLGSVFLVGFGYSQRRRLAPTA